MPTTTETATREKKGQKKKKIEKKTKKSTNANKTKKFKTPIPIITVRFVLYSKRLTLDLKPCILKESQYLSNLYNERIKQKQTETIEPSTKGGKFNYIPTDIEIEIESSHNLHYDGFVHVFGWLQFVQQLDTKKQKNLVQLLHHCQTFLVLTRKYQTNMQIEDNEINLNLENKKNKKTNKIENLSNLHRTEKEKKKENLIKTSIRDKNIQVNNELLEFRNNIRGIVEQWGMLWNVPSFQRIRNVVQFLEIESLETILNVAVVVLPVPTS